MISISTIKGSVWKGSVWKGSVMTNYVFLWMLFTIQLCTAIDPIYPWLWGAFVAIALLGSHSWCYCPRQQGHQKVRVMIPNPYRYFHRGRFYKMVISMGMKISYSWIMSGNISNCSVDCIKNKNINRGQQTFRNPCCTGVKNWKKMKK